MSEGLHNPKPIQDALEPHATRLIPDKQCSSCGDFPEEEDEHELYVLPVSNGTHSTPQLYVLCDGCAMELSAMLAGDPP